MNKPKNVPSYRFHRIISMLVVILIIIALRFPVVFLGGWYGLTRIFYFVVSVLVITYGLWLFQRLRMRYIAILVITVAILIGAINIFRFSLPFEAECNQTTATQRVCFMNWVAYDSLTYANWNEVTFFYTLRDLPVGIWYRSTYLE